MSRRFKTSIFVGLSIALIAVTASAVIVTRMKTWLPVAQSPAKAQIQNAIGPRNLSLQPEAFKMSRRLGDRFSPSHRTSSLLTGNLTTAAGQQVVNINRRQTESGETVEVLLGSRSLKWSDSEGVTVPLDQDRLTQAEHLLIERLTFDSSDQFILAQLRGASYYTVARSARPVAAEAAETYTGPVWDIVRVTDSEQNEQKRPISPSRQYYINSNTGLIDRIVYDVSGERVEVLLSDWTVVSGEKLPARILWRSQAAMVMQFTLTNFTKLSEQ